MIKKMHDARTSHEDRAEKCPVIHPPKHERLRAFCRQTSPGPSDPEPLLAEAALALTPLLVSLLLASPFSSRSA
jgi:hypothetical protein